MVSCQGAGLMKDVEADEDEHDRDDPLAPPVDDPGYRAAGGEPGTGNRERARQYTAVPAMNRR
jgi:hypothetical protein